MRRVMALLIVSVVGGSACSLPSGDIDEGQETRTEAACTTSDDCTWQLECVANACVQRCDVDEQCSQGHACFAHHDGRGVCLPGPRGGVLGGEGPVEDRGGKGDSPHASTGLPCAVDTVIASQCRLCHNTMPTFGAPMPLVSLSDMRAHGVKSLERAIDPQRPMPPPPNARMSESEIDILANWVSAGMPEGQTCDVPPPVRDPSDFVEEQPEEQCDHVFDVTAYGAGDVDGKFEVPLETDAYLCFTYRVPWNQPVHALSLRPIVDDARVLHHYLLYSGGEERFVGQVKGCNGRHEGAALLAGWAPGGVDAVLPEGVGQEMPGPGELVTLEIHYHNKAGYADALDRSGVRICASEELREQTAAVHWLGTEWIAGWERGDMDFTGTCTPESSEPIHIISSSPHMHKRGKHMRSVVRRRDGSEDILIDEPFDFENQVIYQTPMTIHPGDKIETTCTFNNDGSFFRFGERTEDEMCYNFVTAWPVGGMESGGSLVGARHSCLK